MGVALGVLLAGCASDTAVDLAASGLITTSAASLEGTVGVSYGNGAGVTFSVPNSDPGTLYYWTVSGSIPPGLVIAPATNGILSNTLIMDGTPLIANTYTAQIAVHTSDHVALIPPVPFTITIAGGSGGPPVVPPGLSLTQLQGTWTGVIQTGPETGRRLSFLIDNAGIARQATAGSTILATASAPITFNVSTSGFDTSIPPLSWHLVCPPTTAGDLDCIGHHTSADTSKNGTVLLKKINPASQDPQPPAVSSSVPANSATVSLVPQEVLVTFNELIASAPTASLSLTGTGSGTPLVTGTSFVGASDDVDGRTLRIQVAGLRVGTTYTLRINPTGQPGLIDLAGNSLPSTTITFSTAISSVNQPPSAIPQNYTVVQGTMVPITLTGSDPEGGLLTYQLGGSLPTQGTLSGTAPVLTYTALPTSLGADSFTFTVRDPLGDTSAPAAITISIVAANQPPSAYADMIGVPQDTATAIPLIGSDPDLNPITFEIKALPTRGGLTLSGTVATYTPTAGYIGPDQFTFTVRDSPGATSDAIVTITVVPAGNQPPTANPQTFTFFKRQILTTINMTLYAVTLTGTDPESGPLTFRITRFPAHGVGAGVVRGQSYWFVDPATGGFVNPVTGAPASLPVQVTTANGISTSTVNTTTGTMTVSPEGSLFRFVYLPNFCHLDEFAQDTFEFVAIDAAGLRSLPAIVTMNSTNVLCQHT